MSNTSGLQLLPETRKKIEVMVPGENRVIVIGSIILSIITMLAGWLYFYRNSLENKLSSLDAEIVALEQQRNKQAEQNILVFNKQISILSSLLNEHPYWTSGFSKIENLTQNQVQFENMTMSLTENKISFKAIAANYTTIAKQIASFLSDESIKDIALNKVNTLTNGQLEFTMQVLFDKNKFLNSK